MPFAEPDWKHLRHVHTIALDRFCRQALEEAAGIAQAAAPSAHERYLQLFDFLLERNEAMATAFDDMRRSTALQRLTAMVGLNLLTDEELAGFNSDVQETAREFSQVLAPRRKPRQRRRQT